MPGGLTLPFIGGDEIVERPVPTDLVGNRCVTSRAAVLAPGEAGARPAQVVGQLRLGDVQVGSLLPGDGLDKRVQIGFRDRTINPGSGPVDRAADDQVPQTGSASPGSLGTFSEARGRGQVVRPDLDPSRSWPGTRPGLRTCSSGLARVLPSSIVVVDSSSNRVSRPSSPALSRSSAKRSVRSVPSSMVTPGRPVSAVTVPGVSGSVPLRKRCRSSNQTTTGSVDVRNRGCSTSSSHDAVGCGTIRCEVGQCCRSTSNADRDLPDFDGPVTRANPPA